MFHADPRRTVTTHRVSRQAAAQATWDCPIVRVDVFDDVPRDELLEVSGSYRARIHRSIVPRLRVRQHDDHLSCTLREGSLQRLRHMYLVSPLLRADRITVQGIKYWIVLSRVLRILRWQEYDHVPVHGITLEVFLQRSPMDRNVIHSYRFRARNRRRHLGR